MINEIKSLKNTKKVEFSFDRKLNDPPSFSPPKKKRERERKLKEQTKKQKLCLLNIYIKFRPNFLPGRKLPPFLFHPLVTHWLINSWSNAIKNEHAYLRGWTSPHPFNFNWIRQSAASSFCSPASFIRLYFY